MEGKIITLKDGHKLYVVKRRWTDEEEEEHLEEYDDKDISWIGELIDQGDAGDGWSRDEEIPEDYEARYSDSYWAFTQSEVKEVESDPIYDIY